jgi:hypothetical protein
MHDAMHERIPIRADILTHEVTDSDEVVIYDSSDRQLLVLNDFGAGVWLLIDGRRSLADLADEVLECTEADPKAVAEDVTRFVEQLVDRKVVRWRE